MAEVYGNLVIVVILVMECVDKAIICPPNMHDTHACMTLGESRSTFGCHYDWEATTWSITETVHEGLIEHTYGVCVLLLV